MKLYDEIFPPFCKVGKTRWELYYNDVRKMGPRTYEKPRKTFSNKFLPATRESLRQGANSLGIFSYKRLQKNWGHSFFWEFDSFDGDRVVSKHGCTLGTSCLVDSFAEMALLLFLPDGRSGFGTATFWSQDFNVYWSIVSVLRASYTCWKLWLQKEYATELQENTFFTVSCKRFRNLTNCNFL